MIRSAKLQVAPDVSLADELREVVEGEVRFDVASRAMYAHDASNYRQVPIGVVIPRHADDVERAVGVCRRRGVPVLSRGGGTSLAGQTVNEAIVLDFSKYMNRVLDVDVVHHRVTVEPGCVLDDMRAALAPHGLTYGPDPSTHDHCTLGGMLGNNSCGVHSVMGEMYGPGARTSDHVVELEVLTYDGTRMTIGPTGPTSAHERELYRALEDLRDRYADLIRTRFAHIPRRVSGYNLDELLPEKGFNVARALVGTEGTCVVILRATLLVYPARPKRALVVLGYRDVFEAGDHIAQIRTFEPVGLEGIDDTLVEDMKRAHIHPRDVDLLPPGKGWLLVELGAERIEDAETQARRVMEALRREPNPPSMKLFEDPAETKKLWEVREAGLGATAFIPGKHDFWEGWEDSAVPPERVGNYLRAFRELLDRYGYTTALYGHFGQGCIHCRIDFDLRSAQGREQYRRFTSDAADLVIRFGGSLSGEHGDGQSRGELLGKQFGPDLVQAFREFKRIWDPDDRMNPGKIVDGLSRTQNLNLAHYHPAPVATSFHPRQDNGDFRHSAMRCVGIGNCRRSHGGTMCPSFRVTHEEKHTTRGRAHLLYEMLEGEVVRDGWASEEVKDALDLCLACKGCKGDCPVHVDMATYKSEFLSHYYTHHHRPRAAYAFGWIDRWLRLASHVPWLANIVTQTPVLRRLVAWLGGITPERQIPRVARRSFTSTFRSNHDGRRPVILWPDTFNNYLYPRTLEAAAKVLDDAGFRVVVPGTHLCCGRGLYDFGMLDRAKDLWEHTLYVLGPALQRGVPIVGLEPSCVSAFRDELPNLFPDDDRAHRLSDSMHTLPGFLHEQEYTPPKLDARVLLHGHCHHKAVLDFDAERAFVEAIASHVDAPVTGCCGLAGSFGFEREHYQISMAIGEDALLPAVRDASDGTLVVTDGFSCREQIRHATGRQPLHVAELAELALRSVVDADLMPRTVWPLASAPGVQDQAETNRR